MELRVAIVDDDERDRQSLDAGVRQAMAALGGTCHVSSYASGRDLLGSRSSGSIDVVFVDIRMEGMDGIDLARRLRLTDARLIIVFVTTLADYALDAYPVHPFDFLVKPWDEERLRGVLRDVIRSLGDVEETVSVAVPHGSIDLRPRDVSSVEAQNHTTIFRLSKGVELRSIMSFAKVRELLAKDARFLEINRGVLVNMDHIASVGSATCVMDDGSRLPLRKRDRAALTHAITQHMVSGMGRAGHG